MPAAKWTAEQKTEALRLYETEGLKAATEETGIPAATIRSLAHRSGVAARCTEQRRVNVEATKLVWAERRGVMVEEIGAVAHMALAQTVAALELGKSRDAKDLATTMAILVDKAQLLSGGATSRSEHADPRAKLAHLKDELAERRRTTAA
jgi:hypothetical protein